MTEHELPEGWVLAPIGSICDLKNGRAFKPTDWSERGLPIVRIQNLNNPNAKFNHFEGRCEDRFLLKGGELLFAWSGTPGTSFGAHVWRGEKAVLNQHIFRMDFDETNIDKQFFRHAINQKLAELIGVAHGGVGLRHVTKGTFENTEISLPPLAEQKRIADKLDAVLGRVDACRARLDRVPALLKRFRQSVLAAATSGKLTEDWREENNSATDAATALCTIEGKRSGKLRVQRYEHPFEDISLFDLPRGWNWVKNHRLAVDASNAICAGPFGTIFKAKDFRDEGVPIIFLRHVGEGQYLTKKPGFMDPEVWRRQHQEYSVKGGELLVTKLGDPPGTACIYPNGVGVAMVTPDVMKMEVDTLVADTKFLMFFFNSPLCKDLVKESAFGATRLRIDLTMFKNFPIPLPHREEQTEIVRRVEALFAFADRIEARLRAARAQVERLTPATLAKAFRGELVPQDPADEPASALLERLRRPTTASATPAKRGKRPKSV